MPPEFTRPECTLTALGEVGDPATHWTMIHAVAKTLKIHGMNQQATEFSRRAVELRQVECDTTEFLMLIQQYVEIV